MGSLQNLGGRQSRLQAEAALALLKQGPVTKAQLVELNAKYPSDPIYYVRTLLHLDVKSVKTKDGSVYMLPQHYAVYIEGLKQEEEARKAAEASKEAPYPIPSEVPTIQPTA